MRPRTEVRRTMELKVAAGTVLAAWPDLLDPNFMHAVLVMCEHDERGALGFVVNDVTEHTTMSVLPEHPVLGKHAVPIHLGGPVRPEQLQVLHTLPDEIPGGMALSAKAWIGGDLDAAARWIAAHPDDVSRRVRLLVGYAGWAPGQLDEELSRGSWVPSPIAPEATLEADGEVVWRRAVRSVGRDGGGLEHLPPDVSWN